MQVLELARDAAPFRVVESVHETAEVGARVLCHGAVNALLQIEKLAAGTRVVTPNPFARTAGQSVLGASGERGNEAQLERDAVDVLV